MKFIDIPDFGLMISLNYCFTDGLGFNVSDIGTSLLIAAATLIFIQPVFLSRVRKINRSSYPEMFCKKVVLEIF